MTTPQLFHRAEFETLLADYRMSDAAQQVLAETPFVTMLALTSTGRNTIIRELLKTGHYYFIVSDTTRPPRLNDGMLERNGVEYFFRSEQAMLDELKKGQYLEAEIIHNQQVSGVSIREIQKANAKSLIAITDVDVLGAINIAQLKPDAVSILLLPPSFDEWLRRIYKRTKVSQPELQRRMQTGVRILETALAKDFFVFVINDKLDQAVGQVDNIARFGKIDQAAQTQARTLANELLQATRSFVQKMI